MANKPKQGTFDKVTRTVSDAAQSAANAADEYVVQPVSKMLGLGGGEKETSSRRAPQAKRPSPANRTAAQPAKRTTSQPAKRTASTPAKRTASAPAKRTTTQPARRPTSQPAKRSVARKSAKR